ncbi:uncharacterized protein BCR38DRAFT_462356 [Pseudomassariella vexata]|uniref:Uncharacterized protein n=1 Tax=Pseudomassariella vexata TaxID=1141098 RepID=A0A1Y2EIE4_9PEZI|nr:uncharacterized protein BCR38DRAFT_462356 [Pseudomassariella vexata]ORY71074.1 hypothetical protein BCR38DRAFT_462356 [Pseudomassariella vexata]
MDISGNALVIGGGGIGRACAILLAREGASGVMIGDLDLEAARKVVDECFAVATNSGFRAESAQVDVSKEDSVSNIFDRMVDVFGRVDYSVNCAGVGAERPRDISSLPLSEFQRFVDVNLTGAFLVMRQASVAMRAQVPRPVSPSGAFPNRGTIRGVIVDLCSAASMAASNGILPYTTTKHGQLGLTRNSAIDNAPYQIRVNCICPSWTDTPMVRKANEGIEGHADFVNSKLPIGRIAIPEEVADAGLPRVVRHITTHNDEGKSMFLPIDVGDHHRELVNKSAIANILYSTHEHPVNLNGDADVKYARENEPGITVKNGTVCRLIDFAPGTVSPLHRVKSIDYAVVIEGVFKMVLDSGEERVLHRGDVAINRSTAHRWINVTGGGLLPARILFVLQDIRDLTIAGKNVDKDLGVLEKDYVGLPGHAGPAPLVGGGGNDEKFDSEF